MGEARRDTVHFVNGVNCVAVVFHHDESEAGRLSRDPDVAHAAILLELEQGRDAGEASSVVVQG